ncbi:hypothetical protein NPIL_321712 [Nephila pilipes]|uniref:Uncharacterized protein n=1 Tax=Nephila pilipes TaxID=299642 RepID=A0A8X6QUH8_NEPPI|nr:hypothetical protein NPIL_321712 [Nephila pilipes]
MPSYSNSLPYRSSVFKLRRRLHFPRRCIRFGSDDCNQRYLGVENNTKSSAWLHLTSCSKSLMNELNKRKIRLTWKLFKVIIFIVCVACFSWQSTRFFKLYFAYPTATSVELTFPSVLKYPAITFCNNNPYQNLVIMQVILKLRFAKPYYKYTYIISVKMVRILGAGQSQTTSKAKKKYKR